MFWHLIAYGSLHMIVKLSLVCLVFTSSTLMAFLWHLKMFFVSQAHPGFRTHLVALGFAWVIQIAPPPLLCMKPCVWQRNMD